jgi:hypothetical protein
VSAAEAEAGLSRALSSTLGVGAVKLFVSVAVLAGGFRAVSDDDYARVVIAERFADSPHLDASGTSWLPLPFWVYGAGFRLFGAGLGVARSLALCLGILAVLLLLAAAKMLGAGRAGAVAGALLAGLFPWSAWLGVATVPEAPAAALVVFGAATLATSTPRDRVLGAFALAAACFCRYEAWPVAFGFAAFTTYDALRARAEVHAGTASRGRVSLLLGAGAVALSPIVLWLLHGTFVHGDTLFFWKRVAGYRHALGGDASLAERLFAVPRSLIGEEPELLLGLPLVGLGLRSQSAGRFATYRRPLCVTLLLLAFLATGELAGGGPTHHAGRAALAAWYLVALAIGHAVGERASVDASRQNAWFGLGAAVLLLGWLYRIAVPPGFPDRSAAVQIGTEARRLGAPALLIDTPDYSYFAVIAAFGRPTSAEPFDDRDPRRPRSPDPFTSEAALRSRWAARPDAWLVVSRAHTGAASSLGHIVTLTPSLALVAPGT